MTTTQSKATTDRQERLAVVGEVIRKSRQPLVRPAKHTPGPWRAGFNHGNESRRVDIETDSICVASVMPRDDDDEQAANARLIAAAPELLAALTGLMAQVESGALVRDTSRDHEPKWYVSAMDLTLALQSALSAIAKATGGTDTPKTPVEA